MFMMKKGINLQSSQKRLKFHKTCQTLPLRKLVNLQNSRNKDGIGDNRHILEVDEWPEDYKDRELNGAIDNILREWQELSGSSFYDDMFKISDKYTYDKLRLNVLDFCHRIIGLITLSNALDKSDVAKEFNEMLNEIKHKFKFEHLNTQNDFTQKYNQIQQRILIEHKERKEEYSGEVNFNDLIVPIEIYFKKDIHRDITCAKYLSYKKRINNG
jgi:hypothetical protein